MKVRKNPDATPISSKIACIIDSPSLRKKLEALILLQSSEILTVFNLTEEELQFYKDNFFDVDPLIEAGVPYIVDYLERTKQHDTLEFFLRGEAFTKARLGVKKELSLLDRKEIHNSLIDTSLVESTMLPVAERLKTIRSLSPYINSEEECNNKKAVDRLADLLKDAQL